MGSISDKESNASSASNADSLQVSEAFASSQPSDGGFSDERRQDQRRAYPVNVDVAPYVVSKRPTEMAFLRARCHDVSEFGISMYLPDPPACQHIVVAQGAPPARCYVLAEVVHSCPALDSSGEWLVGCRILGKVAMVSLKSSGVNLLAEALGGEATGHGKPDQQSGELAQPQKAASAWCKSAASDRQAEINELRKIAIESARGDIRRHFRQQMLLTTGDNLLITGLGLASGAALVWLWKSPDTMSLLSCTILAGLPTAILWGTRLVVTAKHVFADGDLRWRKRKAKSIGT